MQKICTSYVNAGSGWCRLKKELGHISLYCQDCNKTDPHCQKRLMNYLEKPDSSMMCNPCEITSPECDNCMRGV